VHLCKADEGCPFIGFSEGGLARRSWFVVENAYLFDIFWHNFDTNDGYDDAVARDCRIKQGKTRK